MPSLTIKPIPLFADNYAWLILNASNLTAILVDAAIASTCIAAVPEGYELVGALTTHHHRDHAGGNNDLASLRRGITIIGGTNEDGRIDAATKLVADGETFELGGVSFRALHTPCHTIGHVCYFTDADKDEAPKLFSGDTLFAAGCGRFFEGNAATMYHSLSKLKALPSMTRVYCGHEYTVANLKFCLSVEPHNPATIQRALDADGKRAAQLPTIPSTLSDELETNVFLRTHIESVRTFTHGELAANVSNQDVLAVLREKKNAF